MSINIDSGAAIEAACEQLLGDAVTDHRGGAPVLASLIGGVPMAPRTELEPRIGPATGNILFYSGDDTDASVEPAVASARADFEDGAWGRSSGRERSRVLTRTAALLESHSEQFAALLVAETGKPITEAHGEVAAAVNAFEYFAGVARDIGGRTLRDINSNLFAFTVREPAGVAALLIPWNFPLAILAQKLPPALAAGCTVVVKPSPLTPLTSLAVSQLLYEAALPPHALSVVLGDAAVGAAIVDHPNVDVLSFTGSTPTARAIAANAGRRRLKRVALEAGGKTPVIVMADADLDRAVERLLFHSFFNQGQVCVAGSRILADSIIAAELTERLATRSRQIRLGDPMLADTQMGPLISHDHFASVLAGLADSTRDGSIVVAGGAAATPQATTAAPFLAPTVLRTDDDSNPAVTREIFGPVTVVQSYQDIPEVIRRANNSDFGLAASVWTTNIEQALDLSFGLRTGTVWINGSTDSHPEMPLGGRKDSGYGAEFGREGMEFFTDLKTVHVARAAAPAWYRP